MCRRFETHMTPLRFLIAIPGALILVKHATAQDIAVKGSDTMVPMTVRLAEAWR